MKTNKNMTFSALNGRFLDTETNRINEEYLNHELSLLIENTESMWEAVTKNRRRKATAIAWWALMVAANQSLEWEYGDKTLYASSQQLKNWLQEYGNGYDSIAETVSEVEEMRREEA